VAVHYEGRLKSNGGVFDSSRERGREFVFMLGAGGVIRGWELGLQQMHVGEVAKLVCPPELAYGKKGMAEADAGPPGSEKRYKVPPNATLEFEIEVLNACQPILKDVLVETESNVCPKEGDYVRFHMIVKGADGTVRDDYFGQRPLELYMKDHVAKSEIDGKWKAGNLLKKLVEQMCLYEKAAFTVHEGIIDKYGNKPFWAKDDAPVTFELDLRVIGTGTDSQKFSGHPGSPGTPLLPWMVYRCFLGWSASSHELECARRGRAAAGALRAGSETPERCTDTASSPNARNVRAAAPVCSGH
jgi:hypothetical protein